MTALGLPAVSWANAPVAAILFVGVLLIVRDEPAPGAALRLDILGAAVLVGTEMRLVAGTELVENPASRVNTTGLLLLAALLAGLLTWWSQYRAFQSEAGPLIHGSVPFDALRRLRHRTVWDTLDAEGFDAGERLVGRVALDATVDELLDQINDAWQGAFWAAGVPEAVTGQIEDWLDDAGLDEIDLRQYHSFDTVRDFGTLVTPPLQERGRLPERYIAGETLRQRVQSGGSSRLADRHPAARHRTSAIIERWPGALVTTRNTASRTAVNRCTRSSRSGTAKRRPSQFSPSHG